jgi:hypothetical protein
MEVPMGNGRDKNAFGSHTTFKDGEPNAFQGPYLWTMNCLIYNLLPDM